MFPDSPDVMSRFVLKERSRLTNYPSCDIELIFAELPKFTLSLEQLSSVSDQWLYFIKNAPSLELVPTSMEIVPELQQAFQIAKESNLDRAELEEMEKPTAIHSRSKRQHHNSFGDWNRTRTTG